MKVLKNLKTSKIVICDYPQTSFLKLSQQGLHFLFVITLKISFQLKNLKIYYLMEKIISYLKM